MTQLASLRDDAQDIEPNSNHGREFISARTSWNQKLIQVTDIRYFMADQKYVTVRHIGGEVLIDETLKILKPGLKMFFIIHRNCLIRLDCLEKSGTV